MSLPSTRRWLGVLATGTTLALGAAGVVTTPSSATTPLVGRHAQHRTARGVRTTSSRAGSGVLADAVAPYALGTPHSLLSAAAPIDFVVQLTPRHAAELRHLAAAVSDPTSAQYRHFLSADELRTRYAPSPAALRTVRAWVRTSGLHLDAVSPQHTFVRVHGAAAAVGSAFATTFGDFLVDGLTLHSPLTAPVLPSVLRGVVSNVAGLAQSAPLRPTATPAPVFLNARPCSTYYGQKQARRQPRYQGAKQPYAVCGYTGHQLRTAYGLDRTGLTGKGATVGVVDAFASPTIRHDANTYARKHGDKAFRDGQFSQVLPPGETSVPEDPSGLLLDPQGWAGEETLDVEAVHAMAPDAKVVYTAAVSPYGPMLYFALGQAVESGKVQIVSNSYGTGSDSPMATDTILFDQVTTEAAAMGVTVDFSSGDSGDETDPSAAGTRTADFPATSPGVTAVGGTTLQVDKAGRRVSETYWGTRKDVLANHSWDFKHVIYSGAGGGGVSTSYAEPAWQKKVVPGKLATYGGVPAGRVVPDVSMVADSTTGFLTGQTQTFADGSARYSEYRIGGTSLSCPLFSGVLALAVQKRHGKGLGLVTPTIYHASRTAKRRQQLFLDPVKAKVDPRTHQTTLANVRPDYTDPTDPTSKVTYSLRTLGNLATLHRLPGYDDSTGLGSPHVAALVGLLG